MLRVIYYAFRTETLHTILLCAVIHDLLVWVKLAQVCLVKICLIFHQFGDVLHQIVGLFRFDICFSADCCFALSITELVWLRIFYFFLQIHLYIYTYNKSILLNFTKINKPLRLDEYYWLDFNIKTFFSLTALILDC